MKFKLILFALIILISGTLKAQEPDKEPSETPKKHHKNKKHKKDKKLSVILVPVLAANPALGWIYGIAPVLAWKADPPETTSLSTASSSIVFTTKNQFLFTFKSTVFLKNDSWDLMGDWRYFITSQPTFGLGTGPQSSKLVSTGFEYEDGLLSDKIDTPQMIEFNFFRFYETALIRIKKDKRFFAGIGYHLDIHSKVTDNLLALDSIPPAITSHYAYSKKYGFDITKQTTSGVSINALLDSRDNVTNPYTGMYALITFKVNPEWLGSDKSSSTLWLEYRDYINLKKDRPRNLLAIWLYGNFETSGKLPYMDLPALGWDQFGRSGRAYPQGRFRGESVIYSELEWRFPIQKKKNKWGGVIFANFTTASNKNADINLYKYVNTGVGAGLRFMLNSKNRTNLSLDYAFGNYGAHGFYLGVNEAF